DTRRVGVGLLVGDGLLAQEVDGEGAARPPQALEAIDSGRRIGADDELARHPRDVAAGHRRSGRFAERDVVGNLETEVERAGDVGGGEVLVEVAQHVGVAGGGREDVDEPEQLGLERRVRHRPLEHALAPPRALHDVGPLSRAEVGDAVSEGAHLGLEGRPHTSRVRLRARYGVTEQAYERFTLGTSSTGPPYRREAGDLDAWGEGLQARPHNRYPVASTPELARRRAGAGLSSVCRSASRGSFENTSVTGSLSPRRFCSRSTSATWFHSTKVTTMPVRPARAVRPERWRYAFWSWGGS